MKEDKKDEPQQTKYSISEDDGTVLHKDLSEEQVIDEANTIFYWDIKDNEAPEIKTFKEAEKALSTLDYKVRSAPPQVKKNESFEVDILGNKNRFKDDGGGKESMGLKAIEKNRKIIQTKLNDVLIAEKNKDTIKSESLMREAIVLAERSNSVLATFEKEFGRYREPYNIRQMKDKISGKNDINFEWLKKGLITAAAKKKSKGMDL